MEESKNPYIFDIQRFSIHDGPGIRTVLFTKTCPLSCTWCQNPESQKGKAEIAFYSEHCSNCNHCTDICPVSAIDPLTRISDYTTCMQCGACIDACGNNARRMIGSKMGKEEIMVELLKDIDFYNNSGGGVTFSGGEPFMHTTFIYEISRELKEHDIHVNVETCGYFNMDQVKKLLPYIDLIYYDIKHMDNKLHESNTGIGNEKILNNFSKLNAVFRNIRVRITLIPGVNDDIEHIRDMCRFLIANGHDNIDILSYHSMGNSKAIRIFQNKKLFKAQSYNKEELIILQSHFSQYGINAKIYD